MKIILLVCIISCFGCYRNNGSSNSTHADAHQKGIPTKMDNNEITLLWNMQQTNNWPAEDIPPVNDFLISPFNAYRIVEKSRRLSLKHAWNCYYDDRFYYITDVFLGVPSKKRIRMSLRIDGKTGEISVAK